MTIEITIIIAQIIVIAVLAVYVWRMSDAIDKLQAEAAKNFYKEIMKRHTHTRKVVRFVNVEKKSELDKKVRQLQENGWKYNPSASHCPFLLCFEKTEPVNEGEL